MVSFMFELFMVLLYGVKWFSSPFAVLFQLRDALKWSLCRVAAAVAVEHHT
jgi:hypothetical protein